MDRLPESNECRPRGSGPVLPVLLFIALVGTAVPSQAQVVSGRLMDASSKEPILLGRVVLLDTLMNVIDQTLTDDRGRFQLTAKQAGSFYVIADRLGYSGAIDGILDIATGGFIEIEFYLRPEAIVLDALNVSAQRQYEQLLERSGFFDRRNMGFGHFITPQDIERRPPFDEADLFRRVPFVGVEPGFGGTAINVLSRGTRCTPEVFIDGMRAPFPPGQEGVISALIDVEEIIAAEVFRGAAEIPAQYGAFNTCGVILIWTWRG